jgi:hypothetical protein
VLLDAFGDIHLEFLLLAIARIALFALGPGTAAADDGSGAALEAAKDDQQGHKCALHV